MRPLVIAWFVGVPGLSGAQAEEGWKSARTVDGVEIESRSRDSKYLEHRGEVSLCADLQSVLFFVADVDHIADWVPYTASATVLEQLESGVIYHVVTKAPWPYRPRDMIYELAVHLQGDHATVDMTGRPTYLPDNPAMVRMRAAEGEWSFTTDEGRLRVSLRLWVDAGGGPRLLVNRRASATLGGMLANLRDHFDCDTPTSGAPDEAPVEGGARP